ncbi:hypothetical protein TRFO_25597 [Tritrichomonas foetus]|uniref:Uncharacterized protein n=1 Tax=Tritrichomonas foetus TaxID=1144522 RepID=A0A1J4K4F7_9EUKA|nr:hypothetical protein TRFO_25597 [Tritrichomonas foetus]|eukprot:OHT06329.1 hypothetical protein TRFO_25597 [Tritrichomonas foetus]
MSIGERDDSALRFNQRQFANDLMKQIQTKNQEKLDQIYSLNNLDFNSKLTQRRFSSLQNSPNKSNGGHFRTTNYSNHFSNSLNSNSYRYSDHKFDAYNQEGFISKISKIEEKMENNFFIFETIQENEQSNIQNFLQKIETEIQQIRSSIESISSYKISASIQPISSQIQNLKKIIELNSNSIHHSSASSLQNCSNAYLELSSNASMIKENFNHADNFIQKEIDLVTFEKNRINKKIFDIPNKLKILDNKDKNIVNSLFIKNEEVHKIDNSTIEKFENFQKITNDKILTTSENFVNDFINLSTERKEITNGLHSKIQWIQSNVSSSVTKISELLQKMQKEYQQSIQDLSNSIKNEFTSTQNDCSDMITNLYNQLESLILDTESNFKAFQTEIVDTIFVTSNNHEKEISSILSVLETESQIRKRNFEEIENKLATFLTKINNECDIQNKQYKDILEQAKNESLERFSSSKLKLQKEIAPLNEIDGKLDDLEKRIQEVELSIDDIRNQMVSLNEKCNNNIKEIYYSLEEEKNYHRSKTNLFEKEINQNSQKHENQFFATESYISLIQQKIISSFEVKEKEIEAKFEKIYSYIQNLNTFGRDPNIHEGHGMKEFKSELKENISSTDPKNQTDNTENIRKNDTDKSKTSTNRNRSESYFTYYDFEEEEEEEEALFFSSQDTFIIEDLSEPTFFDSSKTPKGPTQKPIIIDPPIEEILPEQSDSEADDECTDEFTFNSRKKGNSDNSKSGRKNEEDGQAQHSNSNSFEDEDFF